MFGSSKYRTGEGFQPLFQRWETGVGEVELRQSQEALARYINGGYSVTTAKAAWKLFMGYRAQGFRRLEALQLVMAELFD